MDERPDAGPTEITGPVRATPGLMMRFLVVVIGVLTFGMGRAVQQAGGALGVSLGAVIELAGAAIVVIASGLVEWYVRRRRHRGRPTG